MHSASSQKTPKYFPNSDFPSEQKFPEILLFTTQELPHSLHFCLREFRLSRVRSHRVASRLHPCPDPTEHKGCAGHGESIPPPKAVTLLFAFSLFCFGYVSNSPKFIIITPQMRACNVQTLAFWLLFIFPPPQTLHL